MSPTLRQENNQTILHETFRIGGNCLQELSGNLSCQCLEMLRPMRSYSQSCPEELWAAEFWCSASCREKGVRCPDPTGLLFSKTGWMAGVTKMTLLTVPQSHLAGDRVRHRTWSRGCHKPPGAVSLAWLSGFPSFCLYPFLASSPMTVFHTFYGPAMASLNIGISSALPLRLCWCCALLLGASLPLSSTLSAPPAMFSISKCIKAVNTSRFCPKLWSFLVRLFAPTGPS